MGKVALLAVLILAGCQSAPQGGFCSIAKPIRLTEAQIDTLRDAQVREFLSHNETGRRLCSWRA